MPEKVQFGWLKRRNLAVSKGHNLGILLVFGAGPNPVGVLSGPRFGTSKNPDTGVRPRLI